MSWAHFQIDNLRIKDTSNDYVVIELKDDIEDVSCSFNVEHKDAYEFFTALSQASSEIAKLYKEARRR
jgi:hypothetical protein